MNERAERTCIGCRERDENDALLRFVLAGDPPEVVPDVRRGGGGRGANVHPRRACLDAAVRTGAFRRAFKRELQPDGAQLARWAREQYQRRIDGLLVAAARSGNAALGTDRVREALQQRRVCMLVVAEDSADRRDELIESARRLGGSCLVRADKSELGRLFGREQLAVVGVTDPAIARAVDDAARHVAELAEAS